MPASSHDYVRRKAAFLALLMAAVLLYVPPNLLFATPRRPRVGLVLAGGGALGCAHVGVLKVLEEERIQIDFIVGTSMGALVGAAYASGSTIEEMQHLLNTTDWDAVFNDGPSRQDLPYRFKGGREREIVGEGKLSIQDGKAVVPMAFIQGQKLLSVLQRLYAQAPTPVNFDSLPIPYRAVAADIENGEAVVIGEGDLALAARASMAVPGLFAPVEMQGRKLVDGGIANNLPVDVAQAKGVDVIIAVELYADFKKAEELTNPLSIAGQMISLLLEQNSKLQRAKLKSKDILIAPDLKGFSAADFAKAEDLMARGEAAARALKAMLRVLSRPEGEYQSYQLARTGVAAPAPILEFVRIDNHASVPIETIQKRVETRVGDPFERERIEADVGRVHDLGPFRLVRYTLNTEDGKPGLVISADEKPWWKEYLRFGASIQDDFKNESTYSLAAAYRQVFMEQYPRYFEIKAGVGGALGISAELYQPWGSSPYFIAPKFDISRDSLFVRQAGDIIAEYHTACGEGMLRGGRALGNHGEGFIGLRRGKGRFSRSIGNPDLPASSFESAFVGGGLSYDSLDQPDFPRLGAMAQLEYWYSSSSLGADSNFSLMGGGGALPLTWGEDTLLLAGAFGWSPGVIPVEYSNVLGGFLNVSGFSLDSLTAADYALGRAVFYRKIAALGPTLFGGGFYGGASLEFATIHNDIPVLNSYPLITAGSLFLGLDTPLVPIYLGFGLNDDSQQAIYLVLGRLPAGIRR